jgi:hypothetical protein
MSNDLVVTLEREFEKERKEWKIKATLKEFDEIFFFYDFIQKEGFVSKNLLRQLTRRIVELYVSWAQYLHNILVVNPGSLTSMVESQAFAEGEKEEIGRLFDKFMILSTEHNIIGLTKDKKREAQFFDEALSFWKEVNPTLMKIMKKVNQRWAERSKAKPVKEDKELRRIYG